MAITKVSDFSISDFPADTTFLLDTNVLYFARIFEDGELEQQATVREFRTVQEVAGTAAL